MLVKILGFFTAFITFVVSTFNPIVIRPASEKGTDFTECKNVIFMIGDGMGFNSINKTKAEEGLDSIVMDSFPLKGESETRSSNKKVTDSAAGGTALACAVRTSNGAVGVYPYDKYDFVSHPVNLAELAVSQGKKSGVITTEFGWSFIDDKTDMNALEEGSRSFGQFRSSVWHQVSSKSMPTLTEMTAKAIDLLDDDEDGFFLMVEGAHIDKNSHSNDGEGMKDALLSFDKAIGYALEYAKTHGDTLVIVTADHETGGITLKDGEYVYTSGSHSGVNVPLLVYGCDNFMKDGEVMKNREASRRVACVMGEKNFPIRERTVAEHGERDLPGE